MQINWPGIFLPQIGIRETIYKRINMKTFKDLEFKPHSVGSGKQAKIFFPNGYGASVVRFTLLGMSGYGSYTDNENEWELAVLKGDERSWSITYDTHITDDVMGHLTEDEVTETLKLIQQL